MKNKMNLNSSSPNFSGSYLISHTFSLKKPFYFCNIKSFQKDFLLQTMRSKSGNNCPNGRLANTFSVNAQKTKTLKFSLHCLKAEINTQGLFRDTSREGCHDKRLVWISQKKIWLLLPATKSKTASITLSPCPTQKNNKRSANNFFAKSSFRTLKIPHAFSAIIFFSEDTFSFTLIKHWGFFSRWSFFEQQREKNIVRKRSQFAVDHLRKSRTHFLTRDSYKKALLLSRWRVVGF